MNWQIDDEVGPYRITGQIGSGGMATVYRAHQPKLDREVAIKAMHQSFAQQPDFLRRFEREAKIAARLDHPNIVPIYDYDEHNGQPYLVFKHIEGQTLKQMLRKGALTPEQTRDILTQIANALTYAHEQGVLHRDVKPSNIIVDERGTAYLTDFGLARLAQQGESTMSAESMLGTPHYISPEQARGSADLDARADVYSLGVVMYELLTGRVPFMSDTSYAVIHDHINTPPPDPASIKPDMPPAVQAVLLRALAKDPADRYPTPDTLVAAYLDAIEGSVVTAPVEQIAPSPADSDSEREGMKKRRVEIRFGEGSEFYDGNEKFRRWAEQRKNKPEPDDDDALTTEEHIRMRVKARMKKSREAFRGLVWQIIFFVIVNFVIFNAGDWLSQMHINGELIAPPFHLWFTFVFWGLGLLGQFGDYWVKHGPGRERRERRIDREVERERARLGLAQEKAKNEDRAAQRLRLTEDGELSESFIEEIEADQRRR